LNSGAPGVPRCFGVSGLKRKVGDFFRGEEFAHGQGEFAGFAPRSDCARVDGSCVDGADRFGDRVVESGVVKGARRRVESAER
jgi:hypothetical protein